MNTHTQKDPRNPAKLTPFAKIDDAIRQWVEDVTDSLSDVYNKEPEQVENESRDGFIPYTEGGWIVTAHDDLWSCIGSGNVPTMLRACADRQQKECGEAWDEEHPEAPYDTLFAKTTEDEGQQVLPGVKTSAEATIAEERLEAFYEFEQSYMTEGLNFFWKIRALYYDVGNRHNITGKPEVLFCVGLNDDFEYGRDSISWLKSPSKGGPGTHWLWEKTVPVSRVKRSLEKLKREAIAALGDA